MTGGFVLIHRSLWEHTGFRDLTEAAAFAWMISRAAWQPTKVRYKDRVVNLKRGQLSISLQDLASRTGWGIGKTRGFLDRLKNEHTISVENRTRLSVITICNYDQYQPDDQHRSTPPPASAAHPQHTPSTQNKKDNKGKTKQGRERAREPSGAGTRSLDEALAHREATQQSGKYRSEMTPKERKAFDRKVEKLRVEAKAMPTPARRPPHKLTHVAMSPEDREAGLKLLAQMNRSP